MNEDANDNATGDENDAEVLETVENLPMSSERDESKKKKTKKGVFNKEWLTAVEYQPFSKEYKSDSSQATCIACNQQFSVHYRGKTDIDNHMKINRQLITKTMKPTREKDEIAATEGILVYHGVQHGHSYLAQQYLTNVCRNIFSSSPVANARLEVVLYQRHTFCFFLFSDYKTSVIFCFF
jgi:hypothetical protein